MWNRASLAIHHTQTAAFSLCGQFLLPGHLFIVIINTSFFVSLCYTAAAKTGCGVHSVKVSGRCLFAIIIYLLLRSDSTSKRSGQKSQDDSVSFSSPGFLALVVNVLGKSCFFVLFFFVRSSTHHCTYSAFLAHNKYKLFSFQFEITTLFTSLSSFCRALHLLPRRAVDCVQRAPLALRA